MSQTPDPFAGRWTLNPQGSTFDPNHRPRAGSMRIDVGRDGAIVMVAEGVNGKGEPCAERPQRLHPDGRDYPVADLPGLVVNTVRPDARTLRTECRREDGSIVGAGSFVIEEDGRSLVATTSGWDSQLRQFTQTTRWERSSVV
jgi:hypothetical protein